MVVKRTSNIRRRNRSNGRRNNFTRNGFDNNSQRPKGSVSKILEKYLNLAQDAQSNGDRIKAEGFYQHAEHYQRIMNSTSFNNETKSTNGGSKNSEIEQLDKTESRTQRAESRKNQRLEKNISNQENDLESENSSFTPDGVEALKAFSTPLTENENKEN